ncbi:MAG: cytochrome c oxidase subunit 2A [Actinomycetota bacterium]
MTKPGSQPGTGSPPGSVTEEEHFRPVGTVFLLAMFVLTMILLWASVYVILISRGVTT